MKELNPNSEYVISGAYKTKTKYGEKVVLKLDDSILYLPSRFISLGDDAINRLCDGVFSITKTPLREGADNTLFKLELKQILPTDTFYLPYKV